jgi:hypothetical protein
MPTATYSWFGEVDDKRLEPLACSGHGSTLLGGHLERNFTSTKQSKTINFVPPQLSRLMEVPGWFGKVMPKMEMALGFTLAD